MSNLEMPLVLFSVFSQTAIGLVVINGYSQATDEAPITENRKQWGVALVFLITGMVASFFHLGHPLQAYTTLMNLGNAWLSRELLGIFSFLVLAILGFFITKNKLIAFVAALVGLVTLFFMGMTYAPPGYPALNNMLPFAFFLITSMLLGSSFSSWFIASDEDLPLPAILATTLIVALVVYLLVPCIWFSGSTIMAETSQAWLSSPLYWGRICIGLVLPLLVLWRTKRIPIWLPVIILIGELLGRASFFQDSIHAASNIGGLY